MSSRVIPVFDAASNLNTITDRIGQFPSTTLGEAHFRENLGLMIDALG